jgi:hypothetical protein
VTGEFRVELADGSVLIAGGYVEREGEFPSDFRRDAFVASDGVRQPAGRRSHDRAFATALRLRVGRVLVTGGESILLTGEDAVAVVAEVWSAEPARFSDTGPMSLARSEHTATELRDGRVLVVGGQTPYGETDAAEVWDPATAGPRPAR